jgi:hypothetical protein
MGGFKQIAPKEDRELLLKGELNRNFTGVACGLEYDRLENSQKSLMTTKRNKCNFIKYMPHVSIEASKNIQNKRMNKLQVLLIIFGILISILSIFVKN